MIEREGWEVWLPCYEEDEIPFFVYDLFKPLKEMAEIMCCKVCNRIECDGNCHSAIFLDKEDFEFVAIAPKDTDIKNTLQFDIGDVFRCIDEKDLWHLIKEEMY